MSNRPRSHSVRLLAYLQAAHQRRSAIDFHSPDGFGECGRCHYSIRSVSYAAMRAELSLALLCTAHRDAHTPHAACSVELPRIALPFSIDASRDARGSAPLASGRIGRKSAAACIIVLRMLRTSEITAACTRSAVRAPASSPTRPPRSIEC